MGPDEALEGLHVGTPWRAQGVRTSIVHRYGTIERSVEPLGDPVVPKQGSDGNPSEPDMARRITRLPRISVRLIYGPIWDHTGP